MTYPRSEYPGSAGQPVDPYWAERNDRSYEAQPADPWGQQPADPAYQQPADPYQQQADPGWGQQQAPGWGGQQQVDPYQQQADPNWGGYAQGQAGQAQAGYGQAGYPQAGYAQPGYAQPEPAPPANGYPQAQGWEQQPQSGAWSAQQQADPYQQQADPSWGGQQQAPGWGGQQQADPYQQQADPWGQQAGAQPQTGNWAAAQSAPAPPASAPPGHAPEPGWPPWAAEREPTGGFAAAPRSGPAGASSYSAPPYQVSGAGPPPDFGGPGRQDIPPPPLGRPPIPHRKGKKGVLVGVLVGVVVLALAGAGVVYFVQPGFLGGDDQIAQSDDSGGDGAPGGNAGPLIAPKDAPYSYRTPAGFKQVKVDGAQNEGAKFQTAVAPEGATGDDLIAVTAFDLKSDSDELSDDSLQAILSDSVETIGGEGEVKEGGKLEIAGARAWGYRVSIDGVTSDAYFVFQDKTQLLVQCQWKGKERKEAVQKGCKGVTDTLELKTS